ncbi:MAG: hypothetical protein ACRDQX_09175 [Pseudonocardiaceae bacterium]
MAGNRPQALTRVHFAVMTTPDDRQHWEAGELRTVELGELNFHFDVNSVKFVTISFMTLRGGGLTMGVGRVGLTEVLLRGVEKAMDMQQAPVAGYVARLRRTRPDTTPSEVIAVLEKRYLAVVTGAGAAVGGAAAVPAVGAVLALALSSGETVVFLQATMLFVLAVAEVHGIGGEEVERRRALVLAVVVGDHGAMLVEKIAGQTGEHWGELLPDVVPISSTIAVNKTLGGWFLAKYGHKRGIVAMGRVAPLGFRVAIGAGGNRACGRVVVNASRHVFGPPPANFPDDGAVTSVDGVGGLRLCAGG